MPEVCETAIFSVVVATLLAHLGSLVPGPCAAPVCPPAGSIASFMYMQPRLKGFQSGAWASCPDSMLQLARTRGAFPEIVRHVQNGKQLALVLSSGDAFITDLHITDVHMITTTLFTL